MDRRRSFQPHQTTVTRLYSASAAPCRSVERLWAWQAMGVLVSRRVHGAHHRAPFEGNYCIVSGAWNKALDAGGSDQSFFRRLERAVAARTGVEPRCWHAPDYSWQVGGPLYELRRPVASWRCGGCGTTRVEVVCARDDA